MSSCSPFSPSLELGVVTIDGTVDGGGASSWCWCEYQYQRIWSQYSPHYTTRSSLVSSDHSCGAIVPLFMYGMSVQKERRNELEVVDDCYTDPTIPGQPATVKPNVLYGSGSRIAQQ